MLATLAAHEATALGCRVRVVVTDPRELGAAAALLHDELDALDVACSRFRDDSEVRRLSAGRPTEVSPLLAEAVEVALRAARLTDGDVDPTVGAALTALGYDRDFADVPSHGPAVRVVRQPRPLWQQVHVDGTRVTVPAGVVLDLGATAKALGADRAARRIAEATGAGVLVSLGGDVSVAGAAPEHGWDVRVQDVTGPVDAPADGPYQAVVLRDGGLATSSTTARRWVRGGQVLHHLLDPRTGVPVTSPWRTVTVSAGSCVDANTASTASFVRGEAASAWLTRLGLPSRLVRHDGSVVHVAGWPA